jgi:hypothetical protein
MKIDNLEARDRIKGTLAIVTFLFSALISFSALYDFFPEYLFPIGRSPYALTFGGFFIIFLIYRSKLKYHYIGYDDESNNITVRYYSFTDFNAKHMSIEIPHDSLFKIEIKKAFFNIREELIIYQVTAKGVAKYQPIPLTALTTKEKNQLIEALNKLAQVKMQ